MSRIRTAVSLFAAATLCVGVLAGCQSKTATQADSQPAQQTEVQQTESKQTETETKPTETETKPTETKPTSQSSKQQDKSASQTSTEGSSQNTPASEPEAAPEPGPETTASESADVTGHLEAACASSSSSGSPHVTGATLEGNTLTIQGSMSQGEDRIDGPIVLTVDGSTEWFASGGMAGKSSVEPDYVLNCANSQNGLGLLVDVQDGVVTSVGVAS